MGDTLPPRRGYALEGVSRRGRASSVRCPLAGRESMTALCAEFGISRKTDYTIYDRYKHYGAHGLTDRSRRPYRHANQLPAVLETHILRLKKTYPDWGAPKLREKLRGRCGPLSCPAISTVHAV